MTLDEAIAHAREVAEENRKQEALENQSDLFWNAQICRRCAEEHEQLAEWLEELKAYREIGTIEELTNSVLMIEKSYNKGRADEIDICFSKIQERLNDSTTVSFDLPVEEILGDDIDMDDFIMLAEEIIQEYKSLVFSKLCEAKKQLKEQLNK